MTTVAERTARMAELNNELSTLAAAQEEALRALMDAAMEGAQAVVSAKFGGRPHVRQAAERVLEGLTAATRIYGSALDLAPPGEVGPRD